MAHRADAVPRSVLSRQVVLSLSRSQHHRFPTFFAERLALIDTRPPSVVLSTHHLDARVLASRCGRVRGFRPACVVRTHGLHRHDWRLPPSCCTRAAGAWRWGAGKTGPVAGGEDPSCGVSETVSVVCRIVGACAGSLTHCVDTLVFRFAVVIAPSSFAVDCLVYLHFGRGAGGIAHRASVARRGRRQIFASPGLPAGAWCHGRPYWRHDDRSPR